MLFRGIDNVYLNEPDRGILSRMEASYQEAITQNLTYWSQADTDTRFCAGDQSVWSELYGNVPSVRRRQFSFNRIQRVVNMIDGYQRRNRKSIIVTPVENADQQTADQFTEIMLWIAQQENMLETISDAFRGSLVTGMSWINPWMDYRMDPVSGNIRIDYIPYNAVLADPYFTKKDLSDCNYIYRRTYLSPQEVMSLYPEKADDIMSLPLNNGNGRDGKFQYMPQTFGNSYRNLLAYDEYYYRDYRNQKLLIDTKTGEVMEWSGENEDLEEFMRYYPQVIIQEHEIPTVKLAIVVQGKVFYDGPQPTGLDRYPFVPVLAYYNPQMPYYDYRIQGVVRGLRDAQYLYNRRKVIELDILESQVTSGFIYKADSLVDPRDIFLSGQGKGIALKQEAQMTDVQQIQPPQVPPSMMQLSEMLGKEIQEISGINEELLGSATDDKAGILSMLRQGAGLTTLQGLFDNLDVAQRELGQICIDLVQKNFTPGKVQNIIGKDKQPAPQFYNKAFGRYQSTIEDGINTSTQRQMQFAQMLHLKEVGVPIPDSAILEAATLQNKSELIKSIEQQQQQAQQMQQQQSQLEMAQLQAQINLANARAESDVSLGIERRSRVSENIQLSNERAAKAEEDRTDAMLNRIKALKEIEDVDLTQLQKIIQLAQILRQEELTQAKDVNAPGQQALTPQMQG
jgi:hypothetical protein